MAKYDLDVMIFGSSRPQLFPFCWQSFKKHWFFRGNMRVIFHEDQVFPEESKKTLEFLNELKAKGEIQEIVTTKPTKGLGPAMDMIMKKYVKAKYCLNLQEDWEFERPVDVDQLLWVMDQHPEINNIIFNKIKNTGALSGISQPEFDFSGVRMCLYAQWSFMPGIWRMDFVRKHWRTRADHPEGYFTQAFGSHQQRSDNEYCKKNIGAYLLGESGGFRWVRHIGNDWRMASWRRAENNGMPEGCHDASRMDDPYRADWLLPLAPRPVYKEGGYTKEQIDKALAEEAGMS